MHYGEADSLFTTSVATLRIMRWRIEAERVLEFATTAVPTARLSPCRKVDVKY